MTREEAQTLKIGDEVTVSWEGTGVAVKTDSTKIYWITKIIHDYGYIEVVLNQEVEYEYSGTSSSSTRLSCQLVHKVFNPLIEDTEIIL